MILFDCGNHIRIGIRHRQGQTLFLSDMIDVCSSDSPHYGKLIRGMYIAIAQDVLQRLSDKEEAELRTDDDSNIWGRRYHLSNTDVPSQITTEDKMRKALQVRLVHCLLFLRSVSLKTTKHSSPCARHLPSTLISVNPTILRTLQYSSPL